MCGAHFSQFLQFLDGSGDLTFFSRLHRCVVGRGVVERVQLQSDRGAGIIIWGGGLAGGRGGAWWGSRKGSSRQPWLCLLAESLGAASGGAIMQVLTK